MLYIWLPVCFLNGAEVCIETTIIEEISNNSSIHKNQEKSHAPGAWYTFKSLGFWRNYNNYKPHQIFDCHMYYHHQQNTPHQGSREDQCYSLSTQYQGSSVPPPGAWVVVFRFYAVARCQVSSHLDACISDLNFSESWSPRPFCSQNLQQQSSEAFSRV